MVEERRGKKISDIAEFSKFHREFLAISSYLLAKQKITEAEQSRAFVCGLPDGLLQRILTRLQVIKPNHNLDDEWPFKDIIVASRYVLHSTVTKSSTITSTADASTVTIKKEELTTMMEGLGKTITSALATTLAPQAIRRTIGTSTVNATSSSNTPMSLSCYYCQGSHMVARCERAAEDLQNGLLKRNEEGRLVLSNRSAIPAFWEVAGNSPCKRVRVWHEHQQQAVASNNIVIIAEPEVKTLSMEAKLAQLELQVMELRKQRTVFNGVEVPPMPKASSTPKVSKPVTQSQKAAPVVAKPVTQSMTHTYATARDANRLPKPSALAPQSTSRTAPLLSDKVYCTTAPAYNPVLASEVFNRSLKAQLITLTPEELLAISPDVRA